MAASASALVVYLALPAAIAFALGRYAALGLASVGIVLVEMGRPLLRRVGIRVIFLAIGLLLGLYTLVVRGQDDAFVGLPLSSIIRFELRLSDDSRQTRSGTVLYRGRLVRVWDRSGTSAGAAGMVIVAGSGTSRRWGEELSITGRLQRAADPGTDWVGRVDARRIRLLHLPPAHFGLRNHFRTWVEDRLRMLNPEDAALFMALFLGARDDLSGEETFFFRRSGAVHLLALSGFHLGILSFLLVGLLAPLVGKRWAVVLAAIGLTGYLFVAGPKISLLRAVLMFSLLGVCRLARLRVRGIDLLGLSFLICLLLWPASLLTLSFKLSFLALAGILVLGPFFERPMAGYLPKFIRAPAAASIGAHIATAAVLAAAFGLLYPVGLVSSLVLTPLVTAFFWGGLACVFIPMPAPLAPVASQAVRILHAVLRGSAELFARSNPIRLQRPSDALIGAFIAIAVILVWSLLRFVRTAARNRPKGSR